MNTDIFIGDFRAAFGEKVQLPVVFGYSDTPVGDTERIGGCLFKAFEKVRQGIGISLNADVIGCGGGKFHTGFTPMPERIPKFVSLTERYKATPELVLEYVKQMDIQQTDKRYLNFVRVDKTDNFDWIDGMLFFATPDVLSGLVTWASFDTDMADAVCVPFGSGCGSVVAYTMRENRMNGNRCFIGLFDPSVRPYVRENEMSFVIPRCRLDKMLATMRDCCLFDTPAWQKVRLRINQ